MAEAAATALAPPAPKAGPTGLWVAPPLLILAVIFFYPLSLIVRQSLGDSGVLSLQHF